MENIGQAISYALGMAVIHSLWQGLLVFLVLKIVLAGAPSLPAAKKHNLALAALFVLTAWFITTIFLKANEAGMLAANYDDTLSLSALTVIAENTSGNNQVAGYAEIINDYLPYITIAYLVGLVHQLIKLGLAWNAISRIKRSLSPAHDFDGPVQLLSERLGIKKYVTVKYSALASVPGIIGYAKPLILLPISFTCNLSAVEAESILLHELAHIRRNDFLVNLIQRAISVVLFFNPFVQLINSIIEVERENSCDDLVVKITNNPLSYAHGLLKLQQSGNDHINLAVAATGKKYRLLNRIERIMKAETPGASARYLLTIVLVLVSVLGNIAWIVPRLKEATMTETAPVQANPVKIMSVPIAGKDKPVKEQHPHTPEVKVSSLHSETFYDAQLERLYEELHTHADNLAKIGKSPRIGTPAIKSDLAELESTLKKAGSRYTPEFQRKADSIKSTEFDDYPLVKKESLLVNETINKIYRHMSTPEYLQKIQKLSADENARYMKYIKKLENNLEN